MNPAPYADFLYFGLLLYVVLPTILVRLAGRFVRGWFVLATVLVFAVQYSGATVLVPPVAVRELWLVAGYALFQWLVAAVFLRLRGLNSRPVYYLALSLGLLPLLTAKFLPLVAPGSHFGYLGISYVTFRSLDVLFGIQDRLITTLPAGQFLAFLFLFPTISAGPVDRYRRFAEDWKGGLGRGRFLEDLDTAVHQVFTGFWYKFILAALVEHYWLTPAAAATGFVGGLSYMYAYSFYLFFDFAGYSAFAVGLSYLLGVRTPENFRRPFLAGNIRDFWNRWNIGLSTWFRDHVYMRFVMAATRGRWFRSKYVASYLGFLLGFGLMGLWHGTAWHCLLYGVYHAALLVGHDLFVRANKQRQVWGEGPWWRAAGVLVTFHAVCFGFLLFSGRLTSVTATPSGTGTVAAVADFKAPR
jgi:membrane protein involved in D-alanine export